MKRFLAVLLVTGWLSGLAVAADATDSSALSKIKNLEKRLDEIEKAQKETLETQDAILADVKNLKIVVHKR